MLYGPSSSLGDHYPASMAVVLTAPDYTRLAQMLLTRFADGRRYLSLESVQHECPLSRLGLVTAYSRLTDWMWSCCSPPSGRN